MHKLTIAQIHANRRRTEAEKLARIARIQRKVREVLRSKDVRMSYGKPFDA